MRAREVCGRRVQGAEEAADAREVLSPCLTAQWEPLRAGAWYPPMERGDRLAGRVAQEERVARHLDLERSLVQEREHP